MRVLIAPDSFKGSLSARQAAEAMAAGVHKVFPEAECDLLPIADGGEGTVESLVSATGGSLQRLVVQDPLGRPVTAYWGLLGGKRTAVVEMAAASGLPLLADEERNALVTSTYGTGQLIKAALEHLHGLPDASGEPCRLIIGIGGSATNDGGAGAVAALGARFLDAAGNDLPPGGRALADLAAIDLTHLHPLLKKTEILVACDVDNPLCGPRGASAVFGPQKGADAAAVALLDAALAHYAVLAQETTGKDVAGQPGAGAAGGLGAGLLFFTDAALRPGVAIVLEATDFTSRVQQADFVLTGEGNSDFQTAYGKAPVGVARVARQYGKPVVCVSGALGQGIDAVYDEGISAVAGAVSSITTLQECMEKAGPLLESAVERVCRAIRVGMQIC